MAEYLVISDIHFPHANERALQGCYQIIEEYKPDKIILAGDVMDCGAISTFDQDRRHIKDIDIEIAWATEFLDLLKDLTTSPIYYLEGNHEQRPARTLARNNAGMTPVADKVGISALLDLESRGINWIPHDRFLPLAEFLVTHGHIVRKHTPQAARAIADEETKAVICGHTHRLGATVKRTYSSYHWAVETGCMCDLNPHWTKSRPDWANGMVWITDPEDLTIQSGVELIHIQETGFLFRGKWYSI